MIHSLGITNFKAFRSLDIELHPLTVLTGLNSTGKSTVIQAILLAQIASQSSRYVPLNGLFGLALGEALDVLHSSADKQVIEFRLSGRNEELVRLVVPDDRAVTLEIQNASDSGTSPVIESFDPATRDGHVDAYLSAERLGPRDFLEISAVQDARIGVGHQGQYTGHALAQSDSVRVRDTLLHPDTQKDSLGAKLEAQAQAWLSTIVRPVLVKAEWLSGANAATLRFKDRELIADWSRPTNVGFGFSYALPIIVAALTAMPGTLLLVENPEAHLHPTGQSRIGRFLAQVAASGVQVIVETHSDHVINGMRLEVAQSQSLPKEDVVIHFFGAGNVPVKIEVQSLGALTSWPSGFFDQSELDLGQLARLRRRE
jgi:predicted ATPase